MPLAASAIPSLNHVTEVAGEPDDVQFRVKGELESGVVSSDVIDTGTASEMKMGLMAFNWKL